MFFINSFLKSSTIHGLVHISTTRKYARLFWILVVVSGFVAAGVLIHKSFDSWSETPVKTVIETLPIADIKFPKVTVCPPKKTYTDLNYDLMMTANITLTKEMRDEMFKFAVEVINEDSYILNNWTKIYEKDRPFNWYHGYSKISSPSYDDSFDFNFGLTSYIYTSATTGVVTTQYYGEKLQPELVERKLHYSVDIRPLMNENATMHLKVEKVSMPGLSGKRIDHVIINEHVLEVNQTTMCTNFTVFCPEWSD